MARFRGTVQGGRGEAHRLGHATSGLVTRANGWNASIVTELFDKDGEDWTRVLHVTNTESVVLYYGPLNNHVDPRVRILPIDET